MKIKLQLILCLLLLKSLQVFGAGNDTLTIAISKIHKRGYDTSWLRSVEPRLRFMNMYELSKNNAMKALESCDGLLVTGGQDVDPHWYHKESELNKCGDLDLRRDTLEMALIQTAMQKKIPLLAICRGEQILNVTNGGTLFTDIPTDIGKLIVHNNEKGSSAEHSLKLLRNSRLYEIIKKDSGMVNSFHHQAVQQPAANFLPVAFSPDGVIEAIESADKTYFAMGVQWHPERLPVTSSFSYPLGKTFINESRKFKKWRSEN